MEHTARACKYNTRLLLRIRCSAARVLLLDQHVALTMSLPRAVQLKKVNRTIGRGQSELRLT